MEGDLPKASMHCDRIALPIGPSYSLTKDHLGVSVAEQYEEEKFRGEGGHTSRMRLLSCLGY